MAVIGDHAMNNGLRSALAGIMGTAAFMWGLFGMPGGVYAHRLNADVQSRVIQKVRVESYFSDDTRPKGGKVQVFVEGKSEPIIDSKLDDEGAFEFYADLRPLRVVVSAGQGHEKELVVNTPSNDVSTPVTPGEHKVRFPIAESLAGVAALLALGAIVMSWRSQKMIRQLKDRKPN